MSLLSEKIIERITQKGKNAEVTKSEYYKRASMLFFDKQELKQALKEMLESGVVKLEKGQTQNDKIIILGRQDSQVLKYPLKRSFFR